MTLGRSLNGQLIDRIYEAAVVADRWPSVLQTVADRASAVGAMFMMRSPNDTGAVASPGIAQAVHDYVEQGWANTTEHIAPLLAEMHPGFRTEADYNSPEVIARMPVHAEFMDPRGLIAGAATVIQGAADRVLHLSFEGFPSHRAAQAAVPFLDTLRPHFARALSLAALRRQQAQVVVDSLALAGAAAAVVDKRGRLRAANRPFTERLGNDMVESALGLRFRNPFVQAAFAAALAQHGNGIAPLASVAVRNDEGGLPCALHILPITGAAREMCEADGLLLLLADPNNRSLPTADLLRLLFDLTPAEARLARQLACGKSLAEAALAFGISEATARVQLRTIFAKTGVSRQSQLVLLLTGVAVG